MFYVLSYFMYFFSVGWYVRLVKLPFSSAAMNAMEQEEKSHKSQWNINPMNLMGFLCVSRQQQCLYFNAQILCTKITQFQWWNKIQMGVVKWRDPITN